MNSFLEAQNVTKVFGGGFLNKGHTVAVDGVSLVVNEDRPTITSIAGESGSGKTTLARLLLGVGTTRFRQGHREEACPPLEAAADRALLLGDAGYETRVVAQLLLAAILPNLGRVSDAEEVLRDVIASCTRRGP